MTVVLRLVLFTAWWTGGDLLLLVLWAVYARLWRLRGPRLPLDPGPGPLLAVDAVVWSFAEAVGGSPCPGS